MDVCKIKNNITLKKYWGFFLGMIEYINFSYDCEPINIFVYIIVINDYRNCLKTNISIVSKPFPSKHRDVLRKNGVCQPPPM